MGFFGNLFKSAFDTWLENASYEELAEGYEERRHEWLKEGAGDKTPEMRRIDKVMVRRSNEKYVREHPNAKSVHREHGRYLQMMISML
ncbi:MAG: hypothetical protein ACI4EX_13655 [Lachnospiraceae bacterium]